MTVVASIFFCIFTSTNLLSKDFNVIGGLLCATEKLVICWSCSLQCS